RAAGAAGGWGGAPCAGASPNPPPPPPDPKLPHTPPKPPGPSGTRLYLQNNQPLVSKDMMDIYHKAVAILAAAASGLFILWQWQKLRSESSRLDEFKHYFHRVNRLEERARQEGRAGRQDLSEVVGLEEERVRRKTRAL